MVRKDRDYEQEATYQAKPEQKKRRAERNKARQKAIREGRAAKGDGTEVDHIGAGRTGSLDGLPTRVVPKRVNRRKQPKTKVQDV